MTTDLSNGRLDEIKAFATTNGLAESFNKTFARLERYSQKGCDVNLYSDFAPMSCILRSPGTVNSSSMVDSSFMVLTMGMEMVVRPLSLSALNLKEVRTGKFILETLRNRKENNLLFWFLQGLLDKG